MNENKLGSQNTFDDTDQWVKKSGDTMTGALIANGLEDKKVSIRIKGVIDTPFAEDYSQRMGPFLSELNKGADEGQAGFWVFDDKESRDRFDWKNHGNCLVFPKHQKAACTWELPKTNGKVMVNDGIISGSANADFEFDINNNAAEYTMTVEGATSADLVIITGIYVTSGEVDRKVVHVNSWKLRQDENSSTVDVILATFLASTPFKVKGQVDYLILKNARVR